MSVSPAGSGASKAIKEGAPFKLLDLPRELRDRVYYYAYIPSTPDITIIQRCEEQTAQRKACRSAEPSKLLGPLHLVSHQIHDELEEHLARLPDETVTMGWMMCSDFYWGEWNATRFARCPKVTSVVFNVMDTQCEFPYRFAFCYEFLAVIHLFRTGGTKVQTVTFDGSEWSSQFDWSNHGVVPERGEIRITVNVRTLEIGEFSGSLAPLMKMELIDALDTFQELILVDQPRSNVSLWLSETELVQYEAEGTRSYLDYLEWLCNEEWKSDLSHIPFYWIVGLNWERFKEIHGSPPGSPPESPDNWTVERDEFLESLPAMTDGWALEISETQGSPPDAPE